MPTPAGVPVEITSPGSSVNAVEHLSTAFTLEVGDVVSTGTPAGVGIAMKPPRLLQVGDVVRVEIDNLGQLTNEVVHEPEETARF